MTSVSLTADLKQEAHRLGFTLSGVTPAVTPEGISRFSEWLDSGYAGEMLYLPNRQAAYRHPQHVLEGVRSLLMLGMNYGTVAPAETGPGEGRISRYAWGTDYHDMIRERLNALAAWLQAAEPAADVRGVIDTAPLLEREFAQAAGLGWVGKNTMLISRTEGSWFFLAALLTDLPLDYDERFEGEYCGTCTACLEACPTDAFVEPYVLDSRRCISYLTIELKSAISQELREGVGDWLFGCDICQDVCPWNRQAPSSCEPTFQAAVDSNPIALIPLFEMTDEAFRQRFRHTPLWRPRRRGILRNAAIVLGNRLLPEAVPALMRGLNDEEPLVRGAAAWALGKHSQPAAEAALKSRLAIEQDDQVREEIRRALS